MRKPNSATQNPSFLRVSGLRYILMVVAMQTAFSMAFCGCSQLQKPTTFKPMPQPKSMTQRQQQPVEQILQRQDEVRLAAQQAAAEAEALAAEKLAQEALDEYVPEVIAGELVDSNVDVSSLESQQNDIIAEAADRASALQPMETNFQVAQVSYETEIEPETESEEAASSETETEPADSSVRLFANADDMEGVPANFAGDDVDFSSANFLRPSTAMPQTSGADALANMEMEKPPTPFGNAESLSLPLQPMLFNPTTRTRNSTLEGTLRPMKIASQEIEPKVEVAKMVEPPQFIGPSVEPMNSFGPLAPLRGNTSPTPIKLQSTSPSFGPVNSFTSRLLTPGERETIETAQPPAITATKIEMVEATTMEAETTAPAAEITSFEPEPIIVSEEIIVADAVTSQEPEPEAKMDIVVAPFEPPTPLAPMQHREQIVPGQPVVDESLSQFSANYLVPKTAPLAREINDETNIPAEVIADAIVVADAMDRELAATSIPTVTIEEANDFKIQPASNTTVTSACTACGSDTCKGCEYDEIDHGEPMFSNNDFAAPETPGGDFVAPLAVPPAVIPKTDPSEFVAASPEFGKPVTLEAPPESDAAITRVAALPITEFSASPLASNSKVPPVGVSTLMELNAVTWKSRLDEAIELAETRLNRIKEPADASIVNLRLLKALRGQMEQVEDGSGVGEYSENESQYWQHQLEAITTMLGSPVGAGENPAVTDYHRHQTAHATLEHLRSGRCSA